MSTRAFAASVAVVLLVGSGLVPVAQAVNPITLEIVIGKGNVISPQLFRVAQGSVIRVVLVNNSSERHGLVNSETKDAVYTEPGETKSIEFTVTKLPLAFACLSKTGTLEATIKVLSGGEGGPKK